MATLKKHVNNLWEEKMNEIFKPAKQSEMDSFLNILSIIMTDEYNSVISNLFSTLEYEVFTNLINEFSGISVEIPRREDFRDSLILALAYHYKSKGMAWKDIKKEIDFDDFAPVRTGRKLRNLSKTIKDKILDLLSDSGNLETDKDFLKDIAEGDSK